MADGEPEHDKAVTEDEWASFWPCWRFPHSYSFTAQYIALKVILQVFDITLYDLTSPCLRIREHFEIAFVFWSRQGYVPIFFFPPTMESMFSKISIKV